MIISAPIFPKRRLLRVSLLPPHVDLVAHLAGGARKELVLEVRPQVLLSDVAERARQSVRPAPLSRREHNLHGRRMNIIDSFRLDGRVMVVTGAGKGIGEGIAVGLEEAEADLALVARTRSDLERVAEEIRTLGRRAPVVPCDVADLTAVAPTVRNVAGNPRPTKPSQP